MQRHQHPGPQHVIDDFQRTDDVRAPIYVQEAQTSRRIGRPSANPAIVQLKQLINRADSNRQADRRLLEDLRQIVRKYDWPWQRIIVEDAFRDGEFRRNPAWRCCKAISGWAGMKVCVQTSPCAASATISRTWVLPC